uniref:Protein-tyrosine-phosphatase n=1 Tax=Romanomermis culicivorax TaxID=13658 RepID=A0A915J784_ROMCU
MIMMLQPLTSIDAINDYLFISGYAPVNLVNLKKYSIKLVVDATNLPARNFLPSAEVSSSNGGEKDQEERERIELIKVNVDDSESSLLKPFFDCVCDKIKMIKESGGKILVHCAAGISRSATLCIVYLMKHEDMSLREAYATVYSKRSIISPNNGFWRQMIEYETELKGSTTVTMIKTKFREIPDVYLAKNPPSIMSSCQNVDDQRKSEKVQ